MRRAAYIVLGLLILYSSAAWAMAGCDALGHTLTQADHHAGHGAGHSHSDSHSDSPTIHCPDLFGAFLIGARITGTSDRVSLEELAPAGPSSLASAPVAGLFRFALGPPRDARSALIPIYLSLSSLRI